MKTIRDNRRLILGCMLIAFGTLWGINTLWPDTINIMFDGWWTLFIIIPCFGGLVGGRDRTGSTFGLVVGVLLLMVQQGLLSWHMFPHLLLAALVVILGVRLIIGKRNTSPREARVEAGQVVRDGKHIRTYEVSFGEQKVQLDNEPFDGADIECSFGALRLDLSRAIISTDVVINIECSFGGITIVAPTSCGVKVAAQSAFGGIDDKRAHTDANTEHTIYLNGEVTFAGVEIR